MNSALEQLKESHAPILNTDELWQQAIDKAGHTNRSRSDQGASQKQKMRQLRDLINSELVAFHDCLMVSAYHGDIQNSQPNTRLWDITIPLTLFPKREHGFSHIECVVEFSAPEKYALRILKIFPESRAVLMARSEMGGKLALKTNAKLGLSTPSLIGDSALEIEGQLYAQAETVGLSYEIKRQCVETEILQGNGARWRLDDIHDRERLSAESHQLRVILEVNDSATLLNAVGYLQAYSDTMVDSCARWPLERFYRCIERFFQTWAAQRSLWRMGKYSCADTD